MKKRQVIVVGGGIGGSSTAYHMKQKDIDVLMVEKEHFPRDKPCGDGILSSIFPLLETMGVMDEVKAKGQMTTGYTRFYNADEEYFVMGDGQTGNVPPMYCVPRYIFDDILNKNAQRAGVDYIENFDVVDLLMKRGRVVGVRGIHNGNVVDIESDLVVLASGSHFLPSRKLGFFEENPDYIFYGIRGYFENVGNMKDVEFYYPEHFLPSGYVWIFPVSATMGNVGVFITESALKKTGKTIEELLWDWAKNTKYGKERLGNAELIGQLKGWRLPTGKHRPIYADGVVAVGDAGNMIEPFGGGGVPQAIAAGAIAADIAAQAIEANDFSANFLKAYSDTVDQMLGMTYKAMEALRALAFSTSDQMRKMTKYMQNEPNADMGEYITKLATDGAFDSSQLKSEFSDESS